MSEAPDEKRMKLRYAGSCRVCGTALPARSEAVYARATRTVRCRECTHEPSAGPVELPVVVGTPGASARREFDRRHDSREQRVRARHPKLGGLILKLRDDPQTTTNWQTGAAGEERLGHWLNQRASDDLRLLHDRRIPGSRANIDHLAVTPSGVFVIDAKRYVDRRPSLRIEGGIIRARTEKLVVRARDCTSLVDGVLDQVAVVRRLLPVDLPVHGGLCFVDADWPLIGGTFTTRGVRVLRPKKLYSSLETAGPLTTATVADVHRILASVLAAA